MTLMLRLWINVAYEAFLLKNFGTVFEVVYGITRHPVSRLGTLFEKLPRETRNRLESLKRFISPIENFRTYRHALRASKSKGEAVVPFFGVMTRDVFSLENANPRLLITLPYVPSATFLKTESKSSLSSVENAKLTKVRARSKTLLHVKRCISLSQTINDTLRCQHSDYRITKNPIIYQTLEMASRQMVANESQLTQLSERVRPRGMTKKALESKIAIENLAYNFL